jgi:type IV pilus assembly protein PilM
VAGAAGADWIRMSQKIQPIGLDLGHSRVKMVQIALGEDRLKVLVARRAALDSGLACDSPERQRTLIQTIKRLVAEGGLRGRNVVCALPADKVKITSLRLAEAEAGEIDQAVRSEAADRFGLDPRVDAIAYLLAGSVRQDDQVRNEYIVFAVDNETIRSHITLLEEAGLTPVGLDVPPCALFRAFERTMRRQDDREKTLVFLDVGYRYTVVVFGRADEICFVKHIAIGTNHFDEEVASTLGIASTDAEVLRRKLQHDESMDTALRRHVVDALNAVTERLAGEVSLCLRYYTVTFRGKRVERAVVVGGGAGESILFDALRRHLSIAVDVGEPLRGFTAGPDHAGATDGEGTADLALAVGLSLKGWCSPVRVETECVAEPEPVLEGESS